MRSLSHSLFTRLIPNYKPENGASTRGASKKWQERPYRFKALEPGNQGAKQLPLFFYRIDHSIVTTIKFRSPPRWENTNLFQRICMSFSTEHMS